MKDLKHKIKKFIENEKYQGIEWIIQNKDNVYLILDFTYKMTEPILMRIRRFLPNLGAFDISPIVLLLLIWFIEMCMKLYIAPLIF